MIDNELAEQIGITAELTGTNISDGALRVLALELAQYDRAQVLGALKACRRELKGRMTIAAILERLDDGRPGPEEAWSMIPQQESQTTVWTAEMAQAFGVALRLIDDGDHVAARMAFKETYIRMVQQARDQRKPVHWMVSLGHDPGGRSGPIAAALEAGRLTLEYARSFCPALQAPNTEVLALTDGAIRKLTMT